MKIILFLLFLYSFNSYSQTFIQGSVKDLKTKVPLPYCNVAVKGSSKGCMTNEEGVFGIFLDTENDTLIFSYIGYKTGIVPAKNFLREGEVFLESKSVQLKEIVIHGDDDYLYEIVERCRKKIKESLPSVSKVYFQLETEIEKQPVEMAECYYNGYIKGTSIEKLLFKNGRGGVAAFDNRFFVSTNTSRAITFLNLIEKGDGLPVILLQINSQARLKKLYNLQLLSGFSDEDSYRIEFTPRGNKGEYFGGELWIDKETFSILKINLRCEHASMHPFLPLFPNGLIDSVSMNITETFIKKKNQIMLQHIDFNYGLQYKTEKERNIQLGLPAESSERKVYTKGVMYFYDYEKPFILPYFDFDENQPDYRKLTSHPYNEAFWKSNTGLVFTEKQQKLLDFLKENGLLINFDFRREFGDNSNKKRFFEDNNIIWSDTDRLSIKKNHLNKDSLPERNIDNIRFLSDLYRLKCRIFLDVNQAGDSLQHYSASVFDIFQSFYNLPEEPYTNCFINICFDICEIERRKMEKILCSRSHTLAGIDSVYRQAVESLETQTESYLKQVQLGKNTKELFHWNKYVLENLNIDNIRIFGLEGK